MKQQTEDKKSLSTLIGEKQKQNYIVPFKAGAGNNYTTFRNLYLSAIREADLPYAQKAILYALQSYMNNEDGDLYPSNETLMRASGFSYEKSFFKHKKQIEDEWFIAFRRRHTSVKYVLVIPPKYQDSITSQNDQFLNSRTSQNHQFLNSRTSQNHQSRTSQNHQSRTSQNDQTNIVLKPSSLNLLAKKEEVVKEDSNNSSSKGYCEDVIDLSDGVCDPMSEANDSSAEAQLPTTFSHINLDDFKTLENADKALKERLINMEEWQYVIAKNGFNPADF